MLEIQLTSGKTTQIDEEDYELISRYSWRARKGGNSSGWYAVTTVRDELGRHTVSLHRLLLDAPKDKQVDHINGDGLDNRRANLRLCTQGQNQANQRIPKNNRSGFKGVSRFPDGRWKVTLGHNNERLYLGLYVDLEEAARVYDQAAVKLKGEFARLNFPEAA